jgi:hypothetical protein
MDLSSETIPGQKGEGKGAVHSLNVVNGSLKPSGIFITDSCFSALYFTHF